MSSISVNLPDLDEFVLGGHKHFKIPLNTLLSQEGLNFAGRKLDTPAIIGYDRDYFGNASIDVQILIVTQFERKSDHLIF